MNKTFVCGQWVRATDSKHLFRIVCEDPPGSNVWLVVTNDGERLRKGGAILEEFRLCEVRTPPQS